MRRIISQTLVAITLAGCGLGTEPDQGSELNSLEDEFDPALYKKSNTKSFVRDMPELAASKDPVLVYYAVDSEEPFMQTAVDYEVRALRKICVEQNRDVNWVVFLNSHYVHRSKKYMICKNGKLRDRTLTTEISRLIETVSDPDFDPADPTDGVEIKLRHKKKYNKLFKKYPFAHPEVLSKVLQYTGNKLFDKEDHTFFLHLKSHGSDELLLSGLTEKKLKTKLERQQSVFDEYMDGVREAARVSDGDIDWRNRVACEAKGSIWKDDACYCESREIYINQFYGACERKIGRAGTGTVGVGELGLEHMGLGRTQMVHTAGSDIRNSSSETLSSRGLGSPGMGSPGMGSPGMGSPGMGSPGMGSPGMGSPGMGSPGMGSPGMGSPGMGSPGMGSPGMGFADIGQAGGLGVAGMGADNYFGTSHEAMAEVLERLEDDRFDIGFIVFESCESNVRGNKRLRRALEKDLDRVHGYYSANGSLWYRNLDWHYILYWASQAKGEQTKAVTEMLEIWSDHIPTWVDRGAGGR